ncbi:hypothetical protein [Proteiniclasticum ruminis]|uniref:Uncharacterized protein n=1 Tax=Proteiniclasticum ruminis TaxID=398199 RepID=A0A1G8RCX4_9CLOT|nr:hypothetical protein [Proteiniclasticum ruminis]SDJ14857.1 hypothetical protein SAMN05421804_10859 [Proteiniclasticum ruminis]
MKVTSKTLFLVTIFVGGGYLLFFIMKKDWFGVAFSGYLFLKGLHLSFDQEAYDEGNKEADLKKTLHRKAFGKFAPFAPYVPFLSLFVALGLSQIFEVTLFLRIALLSIVLFTFLYILWFEQIIKKERQKAEVVESNVIIEQVDHPKS